MYDTLHLQNAVQKSSQEMCLERISLPADIHDIPIDDADIAFLELSTLRQNDIDPSELSDTLYSHVPVIFLGDEQDGQLALSGIRAGAQDWLLHDQLHNSPIMLIIEAARRSFSHQRNLVVNHARYQSVVEDQSDLIYRCNPDHTVTFVNQAYAKLLGLPARKLEGICVSQHENLRDFNTYSRKVKSLNPDFATAHHEESIHINGDVFWRSWTDKGFFDSNGVLLEVQSIGTDITARRCAEQEAIDGRKHFQSLYENAPVMMQELDSKGRILSVNRCWLEVMKLSANRVIGQHAFRFLAKRSRQPVIDALSELRRSGQVKNIQCSYHRGPQGSVNVIASATSNLWNENKHNRILIVSTEIMQPQSSPGPSTANSQSQKFRAVSVPENSECQRRH